MSSKDPLEIPFVEVMAREASCKPRQVRAADALFAEGATVPFVARYRKEATGGLEDVQLELLAKRREYFLDLAQRRDAILESLVEQGSLTPELEAAVRAVTGKQELEDLYLPYKPRRRTRAQMARERGLEPLSEELLKAAHGQSLPEQLASSFVDAEREVVDTTAALAGARDILAEKLSEAARNRAALRRVFRSEGVFKVRGVAGKEKEGAVYRDYWEHHEPARGIASHRLLAILRGERDGFLLSDLEIDDERFIAELGVGWGVPLRTPCGQEVAQATTDGYRRLLRPSISNETRGELRKRAEAEAIVVFRDNLEALLLQAPLGQVAVLGLDPGLRTGCKLAVVDTTGRVVETGVIRPIPPAADEAGATRTILKSLKTYGVRAVAVGNGTGSRETEAFVRRVVAEAGHEEVVVAIVPETGASVYSASEVARKEFPNLDVSLRGAVSIARRLQDPLAELVKIEPRSLGVGQYQHDVDQKALGQELDLAVERAVNRVGVELNTASAELLRRVSGLTDRLARSVVGLRDSRGAFASRKQLLDVPGLGPKTFELAAGFLRLRDGTHPLDRTGVHPERYSVVEGMAKRLGQPLGALVGDSRWVAKIDFSAFEDTRKGVGRFTLEDIRQELEKPGRDPRPDFEVPQWRADVTRVEDLEPGMILEGRVSNVTNFGAFVDLGVKRDGLVHISELSQDWVGDPRQAVQVGQVVKVKVKEVDRERQRIGLSMKDLQPSMDGSAGRKSQPRGKRVPAKPSPGKPSPARPGPTKPSREKPVTVKSAGIGDLMRKFNRR
ncbi:MAG: RNA-binding transcriptional accessory protein [Deltaproteobacteria bacterium]|nr:RNA-binding transcriptional accessory protein [Deltaproteobacteria bacterium]